MLKIYPLILIAIFAVSCKEEKSLKDTPPILEIQQKTEKPNDTLNYFLSLEYPRPGQFITSPLEITGDARGTWFFEAEATTELLDGNRQKIAETNITAIGDWMTEDWVPFSGTMVFEKPATENGFLVFNKANASGLKEHEMSDTIPVKFRKQN